ncbi:MAG: DUF4230 domain-containing protein [Oribacterium sp.]|nr:DUF4230 domain-containing protein [Oribacterium sp.]
MGKILKKIPKNSIPAVLCVLIGIAMIYTINLRMNATSLGGGIGAGTGTLVGKAIGSLEGMTKGRVEGTEAGKQTGLSAEDTEATIANQIQQMENLEVLVASVKLSNFHTIGESKDYAALYLVNGNVVFTVDMSQAKIEAQTNSLKITIPKPVGTLYLDDSSVEKVAEYQRKFFNGKAEDGFDAYLNTMKKMQEASEETLSNYDVLVSSAKEAAVNQITLIAKSVSTQYEDVVIEWAE